MPGLSKREGWVGGPALGEALMLSLSKFGGWVGGPALGEALMLSLSKYEGWVGGPGRTYPQHARAITTRPGCGRTSSRRS